jgi:hypothetical protein
MAINQGVKECNVLSSFYNVYIDAMLIERTHNWNHMK